jgi:CRISPR-associated endonuclease/helicase Cas3
MTISHLSFDENSKQWHLQSNDDHQQGVATLAGHFGEDIGYADLCRALGELHDLGKEQPEFQLYIKKKSGYDTTIKFSGHPNHAYVGALYFNEIFKGLGAFGMIISGHHSGLKDCSDYCEILKQSIPTGISKPNLSVKKLHLNISPNKEDVHHIFRMIFSCLVDADFLDTETFMLGKSRKEIIGRQNTPAELLDMLETYLKQFDNKPKSEINKIRSQIQNICRDSANSPQGVYSLTVPTGGGKTLSGLLWALRHAVHHGLNRVIIAIPYTSIITQTAKILRDIFGEANVLEHHSAFDADTIKINDESVDKFALQQKLASENWDYPIIVTTNVQLFQSMMASKPSRCRKLHNIKHSVILLDEAQMLPIQHLQPIIDSLNTYRHIFGCSILLTTASQPVLTQKYISEVTTKLKGFDNVTEIIPGEMKLHDKLRRVQIHLIKGYLSYDDVVSHIISHRQILCIVNTRRDALEIFSRLPNDGISKYHLSRMMCTEHLSKTIEEIRNALKDGKPIRVVATQLIEAGVDIDFETVMRQEAGLDSILQAAGRCNREGKLPIGNTYVFSLDKPLPRGFISNANDARCALINDDKPEIDWFAPDAISEYFKQLYSRFSHSNKPAFDESDIKAKLYKPTNMNFESAVHEFNLIEDNGISVIVNYGACHRLINELKAFGPNYKIIKKLSRFSVTLHHKDFDELLNAGIIEEILPNIFYISNEKQYSDLTGLSVQNHWLNEIHII